MPPAVPSLLSTGVGTAGGGHRLMVVQRLSSASLSASFLAGLPVAVVGMRHTEMMWCGCQYFGSAMRHAVSAPAVSADCTSSTTASPYFGSLRLVTMNGESMCGASIRSTYSA